MVPYGEEMKEAIELLFSLTIGALIAVCCCTAFFKIIELIFI